jgi:hypothetical protein
MSVHCELWMYVDKEKIYIMPQRTVRVDILRALVFVSKGTSREPHEHDL